MDAPDTSAPDLGTLERPFTAFLLVKGADDAPNGDKYLHGPAALVEEDGLGSDFDGDDLTKAAVTEGLKEFERLGGQVDWDHLYSKSHRAAHLIGKCVGIQINPDGGAPIVTTQLFMKKAFAREAWEHYECGGVLGYSLQGVAKAGIAKGGGSKGKRVTALGIHMMTLTPMPKGYEGPRVTGGLPQSLGSLMKGLNAQLEAGDTEGWEPVDEVEPIEKAALDGSEELEVQEEEPLRKSASCPICESGGKRDASTQNALLGVSPKEIPDGHRYITHGGKAYCVDHMAGTNAWGSFEPHEKYGLPDQSFKMKVKKGVGDEFHLVDKAITKSAEGVPVYTDASVLKPSERKRVVQHMAAWPLAKLRKHQDLTNQQLRMTHSAATQSGDWALHEQATRHLQAHQRLLDAAVDHKEFGTQKALTTGSGVVQAGDTGGGVLREQSLEGAGKATCKCGKRKKKRSPNQAIPLNKALTQEIARRGYGNAAALASAIAQSLHTFH